MKKKQFESILYSVAGVAAMFLILVAVNFIAGTLKQRVDLTAEKLYTLSAGTKAIVGALPGKIEIRFYCTQGENEMPVMLKGYAQRVEDLLGEYRQLAKGKIDIKKLDPKPDSDAEESATIDGIEGQPLPSGEKLYLGLVVNYLDEKVAMPFLSPELEKQLEYEITRAIARVKEPKRPIIGVMSGLPIFGQPPNPMMMRQGQMGGQEPWVIVSELKRDFDVRQLDLAVEKIDEDIKVLLVIHPKNISDSTQYAIDQFVMRGGRLLAFLDPFSWQDRQGGNPMMGAMGGGSTMDKLLKAWGIEFDASKVVADMTFASHINRGNRPETAPTVLSLNQEALNRDDVVLGQLDSLLLPFAGAFSGTPADGLKQTVLIHTTTESQLVEGLLAQMSGDQIVKQFKSSGKQQNLAIRLSGRFKSAFPNGKPDEKAEKDEKPPDGAAAVEKKSKSATDSSLKQSTVENTVVLFGDSDMLYDQFCAEVQIHPFTGQKIFYPRNGNLGLAQNLVEQLAGDNNLIGARSRATATRPFTKINKMKAQAEASYQNKIKELEDSLAETQRRLNELQKNKEKGQRFILSTEQQTELTKFKQKQADVKKELKLVRRGLTLDIDNLENRLKWINIATMPAVVTFSGLLLAFFKRKRTTAK